MNREKLYNVMIKYIAPVMLVIILINLFNGTVRILHYVIHK